MTQGFTQSPNLSTFHDEFLPTSGTSTLQLSGTPGAVFAVSRGGVVQSQSDGHYSISGSTVTFSDVFDGTERVIVGYARPMYITSADMVDGFHATQLGGPNVLLPLDANGQLTIPGTGRVISSNMSSATLSARLSLQTSVANSLSSPQVLPNGTSNSAYLVTFNNSNPTNAAYCEIGIDATTAYLISGISGTGAYVPLSIQVGGVERMQIATNGSVTIPASGLGISTGNLGVLSGPLSWVGMYIGTGAIINAAGAAGASVQSDATYSGAASEINTFWGHGGLAANASTPWFVQFRASNPSRAAGATMTAAYGLLVDPISSGSGSNFGIRVGTPSGGTTSNIAVLVDGGGMQISSGGIGVGGGPVGGVCMSAYGTNAQNAGVQVIGTYQASASVAYGHYVNPTLRGAANGDALYGMRILVGYSPLSVNHVTYGLSISPPVAIGGGTVVGSGFINFENVANPGTSFRILNIANAGAGSMALRAQTYGGAASFNYWEFITNNGSTENAAVALRIDGNGTILANGTLGNFITGRATSTAYAFQTGASAAAIDQGFANAWLTSSSIQWKSDLIELEDDETLSILGQLKPVRYTPTWHEEVDGETLERVGDRQHIGLVAEHLHESLPEAVALDPDTGHPHGIDYGKVTAFSIRAIQAVLQELNTLSTRVEALERSSRA